MAEKARRQVLEAGKEVEKINAKKFSQVIS